MTAVALADRRLRYLYEISTLLTRFAGIDETLPRVVDVAARALPIRTAALVLETVSGVRSHVWRTDAVSDESIGIALSHAHESYSWFATGVSPERPSHPPSIRPLPATELAVPPMAAASFSPQPYVVLPLVVQRAHVFGVLQVESTSALAEADVLFIDAVTNQVAIAIDRQMAIDAADARVRSQLDFTRAITGSLGEGVIAVNEGGRISFMNPAAEDLLGHPEAAVIGKHADEVLRVRRAADLDDDDIPCPLLRALETSHRVASDDHAFLAEGGHAIAVSYIAAPINGAKGPIGAVLAFRDVMAVKRSEKAQRLLAECSAALGGSLDPTAMNAALVDRLVPSFADACFVDDHDARRRVTRVAATELVMPLHARGRSFGALTFVLNHSGRRFEDVDVAVAEEIARRTANAFENARLHAQTEKAVRDREEVLALVSHDLRSPLNTITMAIGAIRERPGRSPLPDADIRTFEIISRAATRMTRMTRDLLDVSSIEANTLAVELKPTRVSAIVRDLMEALQPTAASRSIDLSATLADQTLVASCDHDRIVQVLTNIVGNAIKVTPAGGRIELTVEPDGENVRFVVCDTGTGISPELLPHVFERNRQARETAAQGRGLGLFITKGIVEAHGGRVQVASEIGVGTAFEFCLLRAPARTVVKTTNDDGERQVSSSTDEGDRDASSA